eukprot:SAG11_NODE_7960_length_1077_cov_1.558282_1_plen_203_part_00
MPAISSASNLRVGVGGPLDGLRCDEPGGVASAAALDAPAQGGGVGGADSVGLRGGVKPAWPVSGGKSAVTDSDAGRTPRVSPKIRVACSSSRSRRVSRSSARRRRAPRPQTGKRVGKRVLIPAEGVPRAQASCAGVRARTVAAAQLLQHARGRGARRACASGPATLAAVCRSRTRVRLWARSSPTVPQCAYTRSVPKLASFT